MTDINAQDAPDGIAIIGMSGRFPGANNLDEFWRNLRDGVESITFFSDQEIEASGLAPEYSSLPNLIKAAPILDDVAGFDAAFFGYTPREAELMDPQQRIFLECAWEALEHAGYDSEQYKGWIGVFAGVAINGYLLNNLYGNPDILDPANSLQLTTANDRDYLTTRVSYKLNLKGPSVNLQTACSTSLVAVHTACQSLQTYQCDMALAGGISIRIPQKGGYWYQEGGITSPDGHCRAFDARAQGTVFGSGVGIVVLKRLADAQADGDTVLAVIRGSAVNNDGAQKVGYTAPSVDGQMAVVAMAQGVSGVDPETITLMEAHGTGTNLGDPIEVTALNQVFRAGTQKKGFCAIGSVKTNIGHASAAAGIAGLIKAVLALQHRQIPPSLHYETPNPKIDFANSPFYVNTTLADWPAGDTPRRAGVSSFGVGGTNAHLVLEEAPESMPTPALRPWHLLILSAKTESALDAATANLATHLRSHPQLDLADVAYTLQVGRRALNHRRVLVCRDRADALAALEARDPRRVLTLAREPRDSQVAFLFSGQGAQYVGMARELYDAEPVFRETVDRCAALLRPHLRVDLRDVLYPGSYGESVVSGQLSVAAAQEQRTTDNGQLTQTQYAQPALFVVEYALARLWMSWGVQPQAMLGHSVGEYVAACLAGVFGLEDALALVAARGRMMQQLPPGAMMAVPLTEHDVRPLLGGQLSLAAINGPSRCVVAGPFDAVEALERKLGERGIDCRRLHTSHAFHSAMLDPIVEPFAELVQQVPLSAPAIPFVSNVTGTWITDEEATDPCYWARHLRGTVRFADGIRELLSEPQRVLLEVGPGQTLTTLARQHPDKTSAQLVLPSLRHPQEQRPDLACMLQALGQLWLDGLAPGWSRLYPRERPQRVPLPTYPFERQRYWIDPPDPATVHGRPGSLLKRPDIADWFYLPSWKRSLPPVRQPEAAQEQATWLIFGDTCGLGARLARQLEQEGRTVVAVTAGEQWRRIDERAYCIRPAERADYEALIEELRAAALLPQAIVHLWNVTAPQPAAHGHDLSFYSLLFLAQAAGTLPHPISLAVLSNNLHSVSGEATPEPEKALLLGPCKVIPQEYPNIVCRSIDIILPAPGPQADELVEQIIAEAATPPSDPVVAYRGYDRWAQTYEPVRLPVAPESTENQNSSSPSISKRRLESQNGSPSPMAPVPSVAKRRLRPGGVYLITGGLGGIGLVLAEELARSAQARLVLTGRSAFPARAEWDAWLAAHGEQDPIGEKIQALRRLEELGAQVLVARADAADEAQMRAAIDAARARFGPINGVIHSAGVAGGGMIQLKTPEQAERVIAPKVRAVQVLDALFADAELDFLVLCSSTIAVIGGIGQVDYCAANAFMDAYAHRNAARRGVFTISINWDAWQEVGMAVNSAAAYGLGSGGGQGQAAPLAHARTVAHPLLHSFGAAEHEAIYRTEFSPAADWVLAEHKVAGRPTLPGTAYLEMVRAAFTDQAGPGPVELREVFFLTPLMLGDDERKEVRTILTQEGDAVTFRVVSAAGGQPAWQEHTRGSVRHLAAAPPQQHDLAELIGRCNVAEQEVGARAMEGLEKFVYWGPRWHSITRIYLGVHQGLAVMELPEQFAADLDGFWLHPAMLDVATAFGTGFVGEGSNYLPLSYRKLTVYSPFTRKIYSYTRYRDAGAANKETISFDITILDERGQELATIEEFTLKRVHSAAMKPREQPARSVVGISSREGVEAFNRIMARTRLPQVVVSTKDLHAAIQRAGTLARSRLVEQLGKTQAARAVHPRPDVQTSYAAPTNAVEQRLAEVWQSVLGIDQVGIHDNFFELGGDSVLAIQIIARCGSTGLQVTPAQLFQHQTIAELAAVVEAAPATEGERDSSGGPAPLTPLQHWMLDQDSAAPQRWARVFSLQARGRLDPALLEAAVRHLLAHHDALRLRLTRDDAGWRQTIVESERQPVFAYVDLAAAPESEREQAIPSLAADLGASLNPADGPIVRAALLDLGAEQPSHVLLAVHPLACDHVSWRLLQEDLQAAYEQLSQGQSIELPAATLTFRHWAQQLTAHAESGMLEHELDYWIDVVGAQTAPLPTEAPDAGTDVALAPHTFTATLSPEQTSALLREIPSSYHAGVEAVLLAPLAQALASWAGEEALLLDLETQERAVADLDLSRTVGCGAPLFPLLVRAEPASDPGSALRSVKEQLRSVPGGGAGYGMLRYLAGAGERLRALPQAQVYFTYQGPPTHPPHASALFESIRELDSPARSPHGRRYLLAISAGIAEDRLRLRWTYDQERCRPATIARLAERFVEAAQALIEHCRAEAGGFTPSDFPEAGLNQSQLDKIMSGIKRRAAQ